MESLYTFFFEFQGGTYIDQVHASDQDEAKKKWAKQLRHEEIQGLGQRTKQLLIEDVERENATQVDRIKNAWCFTILCAGRFGLVTIVKTAD